MICGVGERCEPARGECIPANTGHPAGPCDEDAVCASGACLEPDDPDNPIPGGFCVQTCEDSADCGGDRRCLANGDDQICFEGCDEIPCRAGWACNPLGEGINVCLPDCREVGCGEGGICDQQSGICQPPPPACPYPCEGDEVCERDRCVRPDQTCVTDYHCAPELRCREGRCITPEFSSCQIAGDCDPSQTCLPLQSGGGLCLYRCANDAACPADRACLNTESDGAVCYYILCGASRQNGAVYGTCNGGSQGQWPGSCVPVEVGNPASPNDFGLCVEAGTAQVGQPCNAQERGRDAASRVEQCVGGALCVEDPDDPLDPQQDWAARGYCAQMCNPQRPSCAAGEGCVDFGASDDPETPADETRLLGLCLVSDCQLPSNDCAGGLNCLPYSLRDNLGVCTPPGQLALGEPCAQSADCRDQALCANAGEGDVCLALCDPQEANGCPAAQFCASQPEWGFGVCLDQ